MSVTIKDYLTSDDKLDYSKLWKELSEMTGFRAEENRGKRYHDVTEAYNEYKKFNKQNLSQSTEHNPPVDRVVTAKPKVPSVPVSPCSWITYKKGTKGDDDWIIEAWGRPVTFAEVAQLIIELYKNEDRIYPPPRYKGGAMLLEFLHECLLKGKVTWDILRKYKLK
mgnify:FL=1|tara:strand:+ start:51 stop:548 length:498 start_codon:yes stop_codon:yes gene_type:complete